MDGALLPRQPSGQLVPDAPEALHVGQVLGTPGGELVSDEGFPPKEVDRQPVSRTSCLVFPRLVEGDAGDGREKVDAKGCDTELDDPAGLSEVLRCEAERTKSELHERLYGASAICKSRADEQIEIAGETRMPVVGESVGADDDEVNFVREEAS